MKFSREKFNLLLLQSQTIQTNNIHFILNKFGAVLGNFELMETMSDKEKYELRIILTLIELNRTCRVGIFIHDFCERCEHDS